MRRILVIALLALAGCASAQYEKKLQSYVGAPESAIIAQWGPPDSTYTSGSTKYLTYQRGRQLNVPGIAPTYQTTCNFGICTTQSVGGSPGYTINGSCRTTFTLSGSTVTSYRFEGNDCQV